MTRQTNTALVSQCLRPFFRPDVPLALLIVTWVVGALVAALALRSPIVIPAEVRVTVTATGEKNANSPTKEVWLRLPRSARHEPLSPGWEQRESNLFVSYQNQPASLVLTLSAQSRESLMLGKNATSGIIEAEANGVVIRQDLYSSSPGELKLNVRDFFPKPVIEPIKAISVFALVCLPLLIVLSRLLTGGGGGQGASDTNRLRLFTLVISLSGVAIHVLGNNVIGVGVPGIGLTMAWFLIAIAVCCAMHTFASRVVAKWTPRFADQLISTSLALLLSLSLKELKIISPDAILWAMTSTLCAFVVFRAMRHAAIASALSTISVFFFILTVFPLLFGPPLFTIEEQSVVSVPENAGITGSPRLPNIYLLSLDGLGSQDVLRQTMGLERYALWDAMAEQGFELAKASSPGESTLNTFYNIFTGRKNPTSFDFLNGQEESSVLSTLRQNGYKIQSLQSSIYFGDLRSYWDYAFPAPSAFDYCWSVPKYAFFFGACALPKPQSLFSGGFPRQIENLSRRIPTIAASDAPWFTFMHVLTPGHVSVDFASNSARARNKYIEIYKERLDQVAPQVIALLREIDRQDPNAIIIFHGDHGALMSRNWTPTDSPSDYWTAELAAADRHEVFLALKPVGTCNQMLSRIKVTSQALPELFKCLGLK